MSESTSQSMPFHQQPMAIGVMVIIAIIAGAIGFFSGQSTEQSDADATLEIVEQTAVAEQNELTARNNRATEIVLSFTPRPSVTLTPQPTDTPSVAQGEVAQVAVSVWNTPSTQAQAITVLAQTESLSILGQTEDGRWLQIEYVDPQTQETAIGYVQASEVRLTAGSVARIDIIEYPTLTPTATLLPPPTQTLPPSPTFTVTAPAANILPAIAEVFAEPSLNSTRVGEISTGRLLELQAVSEDGLWYRIASSNGDGSATVGWIRAQDLTLVQGSREGLEVVAVDNGLSPVIQPIFPVMMVREGPNDQYPAIGAISDADQYQVSGISGDSLWVQIDYPPSPEGVGWVSLEQVRISGDINSLTVVDLPTELTPTPIAVVIDGNSLSNGGATASDGSASPDENIIFNSLQVAELPFPFTVDFISLLDGDQAAVAIDFVADFNERNSQNTANFVLAVDNINDRIQLKVDGRGDWDTQTTNVQDILPIFIGTAENIPYLHFEDDNLCVAGEDEDVLSQLGGFPLVLDGTAQQLIDVLDVTAVFGVVGEGELSGVSGTKYVFLGWQDSDTASGFIESEFTDIELWFGEDNQTIFAFFARFDLNAGTDIPAEVQEELLDFDNIISLGGTEGTLEYNAFPLTTNAAVDQYLQIPSDCDYLFE